MRKKRLLVAGISVILLVLSSVCAFAEWPPITIDEIAQKTNLIIIGEVEEVESSWAKNERNIFSDATVKINEVIKGSLADERITVEFPGGEVGRVGMLDSSVTPLYKGERVLLFLRKDKSVIFDGDVFTINYQELGTFKIFNISGIDVVQGSADRMVGGRMEVIKDVPLNELIEIIESVE